MSATETTLQTGPQNTTASNPEGKHATINKLVILMSAFFGTAIIGAVTWWASNLFLGFIAWGLTFAIVRYFLRQAGMLSNVSALTKCRSCEREVAGNAQSCPHCGTPKPGKTAVRFAVHKVLDRGLLLLFALGAFGIFGLFKGDMRSTPVEISQLSAVADVGLIGGEVDAGVKVTFVVTNKGSAGTIRVTPSLSSSEGKWTRTQEFHLNAGQSETLTFFFHEPTVNATNLRATVHASSE